MSRAAVLTASFYSCLGLTALLAGAGLINQLVSSPILVSAERGMQANTAICFLLVVAATIALYLRRGELTVMLAAPPLFLSLLTLAQYLFAIQLPIDTLLVHPESVAMQQHPGRIAADTAACFTLLSLALLLQVAYPKTRRMMGAISAAVTLALSLSLISVFSILLNMDFSFLTTEHNHMSLLTATGVLSYCVGWFCLANIRHRYYVDTYYYLPLFVGALLFVVTVLFVSALGNQKLSTAQSIDILLVTGLVITLTFTSLVFFMQRSIIQSRILRKQADAYQAFETELKRSHLTLKLATDVAELGIWTWNVNTGELQWNDRMHEIYQTPQGVIDSGLFYDFWYESVHPEDRERASNNLQQAAAEQTTWREEFRLRLANGEIRYVRASALVYTEGQDTVIVFGGNLDITSERKLQIELEKKSRLAEQSSLAKSQFLANMSHEIRTPMNGILGVGDLLSTTSLNIKQSEYLDIMMFSANKLLALLNDILDISKIEAGELSIEEVCVSFDELVGDTIKSLATEAHAKGLDYHYTAESNVPATVYTDPVRFGQILTNLVNNAIKFTEEGEVLVNISAAPSTESEGEVAHIKVTVSDTGLGMSQRQIDTVFQPFYQADESITRKYGGTGLGLSIVRQLIELFNGTIEVDSRLGTGTIIRFSIPMHLGDRSDVITNTSKDYDYFVEHAPDALSSTNCIVVDEHEINRKWMSEMLHSWQCNVSVASHLDDAILAVQNNLTNQRQVDIVLIDQGKDPDTTLAYIERINQLCATHQQSKPSIVMLVTSSFSVDKLTDVELYLRKPLKQSEVFNVMMSALGKKQLISGDPKAIKKVQQNKQLHILVAEDHPVNQFLIKEILDKRGHTHTLVENGRLAVEALEKERFDAIVMDVQMPVMDGLTATKKIRSGNNQADIRIIGLTAKALKEDKFICLEAGMNFYLSKPMDPDEFIITLETSQAMPAKTPLLPAESPSDQQVGSANDQDSQQSTEAFKVLDLDRCSRTTSGDSALLAKMLHLTLDSIDSTETQLRSLYDQKKWQTLAKLLHKTKGMLANFCEDSFIEDMETLIGGMEEAENSQSLPPPEHETLFYHVLVRMGHCKTEMQKYLASHDD